MSTGIGGVFVNFTSSSKGLSSAIPIICFVRPNIFSRFAITIAAPPIKRFFATALLNTSIAAVAEPIAVARFVKNKINLKAIKVLITEIRISKLSFKNITALPVAETALANPCPIFVAILSIV